MKTKGPSQSYRPDIDGLRAVAVLSVLFYHAHLGFPGGYVGVDIFFVISGFLITRVLIESLSAGTFSYISFWERRVRRLVPALVAVTIFTAIASYLILLPEDLKDFGGALMAQPLLLVNVYFWRAVKSGYFGDPPEIRPMLHTWSLGVEEQYYVIFPILLLLSFRGRNPHITAGRALCVLAGGSLFLCAILTPIKGVFSFFMLPTRAWELLLGGLLVFLPPLRLERRLSELLIWVGLGLIAFAIFSFDESTIFPGIAALIPCLGASLAILAGSKSSRQTTLGALLSHPALVRIGQISYSLYLWHWPLMAYGSYTGVMKSVESRWAVLLISFWVAYLSWRWIETPVRERRVLSGSRGLLFLCLSYAAISIVIGRQYVIHGGFPANWSQQARELQAGKDQRSHIHVADLAKGNDQYPRLGDTTAARETFLLWGDSHAMSMAPVLDRLGKEHAQKGIQLTHNSKAPLMTWGYSETAGTKSPIPKGFKEEWSAKALDLVSELDLKTVFLIAFWEQYARPGFEQDLRATLEEFEKRKVNVVFVLDVPAQSFEVPRTLGLGTKWPSIIPPLATKEEHRARNFRIYEVANRLEKTSNLHIIDPAPQVLSWKSLSLGGIALYADDDHLTDAGALKLRPLFEPLFPLKSGEGMNQPGDYNGPTESNDSISRD